MGSKLQTIGCQANFFVSALGNKYAYYISLGRAILLGFWKKPNKIALPKKPIQSYCLPGAKIYIRKCTIIK